jgi:hypothetical protein
MVKGWCNWLKLKNASSMRLPSVFEHFDDWLSVRSSLKVCKTRAQRWMKMLEDSSLGYDKAWMVTVSKREVGTMQTTGFAHGDGAGKVTILKKTLVPLKTHRGKDRPQPIRKVRQAHLFQDELLKVKNSSLSTSVPEPTPTITGWETEVEHRGRNGLRRIERGKEQDAIAIL